MTDYFKYAGLSGAVEGCTESDEDAEFVHIVDYKQLQAERDALAAQVEALKDAINKCTVDGVALLRLSPELKQVVAATPQHHLREVRADAGRAGYLQGAKEWCPDEILPEDEILTSGNDYAESIRQEGKL